MIGELNYWVIFDYLSLQRNKEVREVQHSKKMSAKISLAVKL